MSCYKDAMETKKEKLMLGILSGKKLERLADVGSIIYDEEHLQKLSEDTNVLASTLKERWKSEINSEVDRRMKQIPNKDWARESRLDILNSVLKEKTGHGLQPKDVFKIPDEVEFKQDANGELTIKKTRRKTYEVEKRDETIPLVDSKKVQKITIRKGQPI